jgi:hypothetical protein
MKPLYLRVLWLLVAIMAAISCEHRNPVPAIPGISLRDCLSYKGALVALACNQNILVQHDLEHSWQPARFILTDNTIIVNEKGDKVPCFELLPGQNIRIWYQKSKNQNDPISSPMAVLILIYNVHE